MRTRATEMLGISRPIIQAGMVWVSGWKLAAAVSEAGALGIIGAGSMKPELLREHIRKARTATRAPVGVNIPLLRGDAADLVTAALEEGIKIVITSAGHPGKHIDRLKSSGCRVIHVVSSVKQAVKAGDAGCDAVVAEGFEAGGHNGMDETTTLCLVPQVADAVHIPVIAAGGIADGRTMAAALALGADAVQVGTLFVASVESSAHELFKNMLVEAGDNATVLALRPLAPVRLLRTPFAAHAMEAERRGASREELLEILGSKRERNGMFEGNLQDGEFEAGQCAGMVKEIAPARDIVDKLMNGCYAALDRLENLRR